MAGVSAPRSLSVCLTAGGRPRAKQRPHARGFQKIPTGLARNRHLREIQFPRCFLAGKSAKPQAPEKLQAPSPLNLLPATMRLPSLRAVFPALKLGVSVELGGWGFKLKPRPSQSPTWQLRLRSKQRSPRQAFSARSASAPRAIRKTRGWRRSPSRSRGRLRDRR